MITQSYYRILDPKELDRQMPYPPLGSVILATLLSSQGYSPKFFDCMIADSLSTIYNEINTFQPDILLIYDDEFNYLTKMSLTNMRENTFSILEDCYQRGITTLVYTSDAIDHPELYLNHNATAIIYGEGETVVEQYLTNYNQDFPKRILSEVSGVHYLNSGVMVSHPKLPLRSDLDALPLPDFKQFVDIEHYREIWISHHGYFSLNISTSRGCTYGCNWCAKPLWGRTYNCLSPARVVEMLGNIEQLGADHVWITDDIFGLKKEWLKDFMHYYQEAGLKIPYKCLSRADLLLKGSRLKYLQATNCQTIWIGAESGSQKILDAMEKGTKVEQINTASSEARGLGIKIAYFIQFGYLGENWSDILSTRELILNNDPDDIGISISYPLPGTKFHQIVQDQLSEKTNWKHSDDLDMLFHGTYEREFYPILHKLVHNEYRFYRFLKRKKLIKAFYHGLYFLRYSRLIKKFKPRTVNLRVI